MFRSSKNNNRFLLSRSRSDPELKSSIRNNNNNDTTGSNNNNSNHDRNSGNHQEEDDDEFSSKPVFLTIDRPRVMSSRNMTTTTTTTYNHYNTNNTINKIDKMDHDSSSSAVKNSSLSTFTDNKNNNAIIVVPSSSLRNLPTMISNTPPTVSAYAAMNADELSYFQFAALKRLNLVFKSHGLTQIDPSIFRDLSKSTLPSSRKKWWLSIFKGRTKSHRTNIVCGEYLCKSIDYASVPVNGNEHLFNCRRVPILVHECVSRILKDGLETKGLFRVNGSKRRVAILQQVFDDSPTYGLGYPFQYNNIHDIAHFLKKYLRTLPEPLFTTDLRDAFLACLDLPENTGDRSFAIRMLLILLPPAHLILIEFLLAMLKQVAERSDLNQMTSHNLGLVFGPTLMQNNTDSHTSNSKHLLEDYQKDSRFITFLIENYDQFIITHPQRDPTECLQLVYLYPIQHPSTFNNTAAKNSSVTLNTYKQSNQSTYSKKSSNISFKYYHDELWMPDDDDVVDAIGQENKENQFRDDIPYASSIPSHKTPHHVKNNKFIHNYHSIQPYPNLLTSSSSVVNVRRVKTLPSKRISSKIYKKNELSPSTLFRSVTVKATSMVHERPAKRPVLIS